MDQLLNVEFKRWPKVLNCNLRVGNAGLLIGKMNMTMIPPTALNSDSASRQSNGSSSGHAGDLEMEITDGTLPSFANSKNLAADSITLLRNFTGVKTTDRHILYLFMKVLIACFAMNPQSKMVDVFPNVGVF